MKTCPICNWTPDNPDYLFVFETQHWRVVLPPNQSLPGRCAVHLKRHAADLANLHQAELREWLEVVRMLETAVRNAFGADLFNWSCYMNHSFREPDPDPHIHWWAVPRYSGRVEFAGHTFEDPHFGDPYDHYRWIELPADVRDAIVGAIQREVSAHFTPRSGEPR